MDTTEQTQIKKKRGRWAKGESGNPGGRPQGVHQQIDAACKKYGLDLIEAMVLLALNTKAADKDRRAALQDLLDRRNGKALLTQDITVSTPEPITFFCAADEKNTDN